MHELIKCKHNPIESGSVCLTGPLIGCLTRMIWYICRYAHSSSQMNLLCLYLCVTRLGSHVKVSCGVVTSWETGKLVLQPMFYLNLLFQNPWSYINCWLYTVWHPRIDHSHVLLIVIKELSCFLFSGTLLPTCVNII